VSVYSLKPRFRTSLRGVERTLIAQGVTADQVTAAGLVCAIAAAAVTVRSFTSPLLLLCVAPLLVGRLACNALDGMIALDTATARPFGQVFNEFADRVADTCILIAVGVRADSLSLGMGAVILVLLASYLGTVAQAAGGGRQYVGVMGKADRMMLLVLAVPFAASGAVNGVLITTLAVIGAGAAVTVAQRWCAIRSELARR
jgi:CDP-diacylglycerol---glycerol-3-phosphate 3-phosphatidyltransferase